MVELCSRPIFTKHGGSRGLCSRLFKHTGPCGNDLCIECGVRWKRKSSGGSYVAYCEQCGHEYRRKIRINGVAPRNTQEAGKYHKFRCGCSGILPNIGQSNLFAKWVSSGGWGCRITGLILFSKYAARNRNHAPIRQNIPHSIIRRLMDEPNCERCHEYLDWSILKTGKTPHLHHNHETGEIYGFTHAHCNPKALEIEIEKLREKIKHLTSCAANAKQLFEIAAEGFSPSVLLKTKGLV